MNLHSKIMNLQYNTDLDYRFGEAQRVYKIGHREARHAAAELAADQDALVDELVAALSALQSWVTDGGFEDTAEGVAQMCAAARTALDRVPREQSAAADAQAPSARTTP